MPVSTWTALLAQELLLRAQQRKKLLQGVLSEALPPNSFLFLIASCYYW